MHEGKYATEQIYGEGEQQDPTLADLVQPSREDCVVLTIYDEKDVSLHVANQVADWFHQCYSNLCTSRTEYNEQATVDYLSHIAMKWLTLAHREHLMAPLHPSEIVAALKDMAGQKVQGTDGLMVAFYKQSKEFLGPYQVFLVRSSNDEDMDVEMSGEAS
ncbi:hypothetical protein NDU88_006276 [Pleurodeles waltl]|uniref:Uncharacterized protein n=1 Tax=Pleurodeles waltl TaxID=8319 RepID=A0AAV7MYT1_PLEWA|nr:hypothetical protein NDU88_006276 [Pleurodeles waltl]